jgi:hypothetical protein
VADSPTLQARGRWRGLHRDGRLVYLPGSLLEQRWARRLATEAGVRLIDNPHQIAGDFPPPVEVAKKVARNRPGAPEAPNGA